MSVCPEGRALSTQLDWRGGGRAWPAAGGEASWPSQTVLCGRDWLLLFLG